ncbi:hypothetical protein BaRGS_00011787 [Batillaria attramentaria]|uniref:Notch-regulated ankyrin repeat-containing protein n=1 Tax=Batillaria attramentaria TaxID=370345 RepID=A0ABD0LBT8_9CAEN
MSQSHSPPHGLDDQLHLPAPTPHPDPPTPSSTASATTTATTPTPTPSPPPPPSTSGDSMPTSTSQSPQVVAQYQSTLREAVRNGDSTGLRRLLEAREGKINLNVFDTEGQTALHQSCQLGNLELVKLLVKFGADVRLANRDGWSAVHIAAFGGHTDILLYLMTASNLACRRS